MKKATSYELRATSVSMMVAIVFLVVKNVKLFTQELEARSQVQILLFKAAAVTFVTNAS